MTKVEEVIKEVIENGTVNQKLNLLLVNYAQEIANNEFQLSQQVQTSYLRCCGIVR